MCLGDANAQLHVRFFQLINEVYGVLRQILASNGANEKQVTHSNDENIPDEATQNP